MTVKSSFSKKLLHVGVVVRDLDKTVKRLESLGIGPFEPLPLPPLIEKRLFRGKPMDAKEKILIAKMGNIELELLEPIEGASPYQEFLDTKGEGIQHLTFAVDDLDNEIARFAKQGINILMSGKVEGGARGVYLDLEVGGIILSLFQS
jgi:methylmalonyl-CoA/ethylmalonyl-CoA epimerase